MPEKLIENPRLTEVQSDVLSGMLRTLRLKGAWQFCVVAAGDWQTDGEARLATRGTGHTSVLPFHIVAEGNCWLNVEGQVTDLRQGDIVAFPFATGHQLGVGSGGREILPSDDLPPRPWRELPVLSYGDGASRVRLLCGYLQLETFSFRPLRDALPTLIHIRSSGEGMSGWLAATVEQMLSEADTPAFGRFSMLERLTEVLFIEILRHQVAQNVAGGTGFLAALADPAIAACLAMIHAEPHRDRTLAELAAASGMSRSLLSERFAAVLGTSPMRYVRDWRLHLAGIELASSAKSILAIAQDCGYGTEAAFSRAFARTYGLPPGNWRKEQTGS